MLNVPHLVQYDLCAPVMNFNHSSILNAGVWLVQWNLLSGDTSISQRPCPYIICVSSSHVPYMASVPSSQVTYHGATVFEVIHCFDWQISCFDRRKACCDRHKRCSDQHTSCSDQHKSWFDQHKSWFGVGDHSSFYGAASLVVAICRSTDVYTYNIRKSIYIYISPHVKVLRLVLSCFTGPIARQSTLSDSWSSVYCPLKHI